MTLSTPVGRRRPLARRALLPLFTILCSGLALVATSSAALATNVTSNVSVIFVGPDQHVAWFSTANMPGQPACATSRRWAFDLSTPQGQATYTSLQTALATGRRMYVEGKGSCNIWGDSEDLSYIAAQ